MGLLSNERKVKAAACSMHQFCQDVRDIYPGDVDDRVVEAATVYIYQSLARDLFGHRFAAKLRRKLAAMLKYATPAEVEGRLARIEKHSEALEKAMAANLQTPEELCRAHTASVMEAMLSDAGFSSGDDQAATKSFGRFEAAIHVIRKHLIGIKEQNVFLMKPRTVA